MWNDTFPLSAYNVNQFGRYYFRLGLTSPTVVVIQSCAKDLSQGGGEVCVGPRLTALHNQKLQILGTIS